MQTKNPKSCHMRPTSAILVTKFINCVMSGGKKAAPSHPVRQLRPHLQEQRPGSAALFHEALDNVRPAVEVRSRRVGGATYQVPVEVRPDRSQALAIRWLITTSRGRSENTMEERLSGELIDAANIRGAAVKKREDTHRMADANKAFSHYRW